MMAFKRFALFVALALMVGLPRALPAAEARAGGKLKIGCQPTNVLDPHFAANITDIMAAEQVQHHLTFIDARNNAVPDLATRWETPVGSLSFIGLPEFVTGVILISIFAIKLKWLPVKVCPICGRPFAWRKKWRKTWADVRYCSDRCRRFGKPLTDNTRVRAH